MSLRQSISRSLVVGLALQLSVTSLAIAEDPPLAPSNVSASDGETELTVRLTHPQAGLPIVANYELFRSSSTSTCVGSPLVTLPVAANPTVYTDAAVTPGLVYYYSARATGPGGQSPCSNFDSGYSRLGAPNNIQATDGTSTESVQVSWLPPTPAGQIVTNYRLYRSTTETAQCVGAPLITIGGAMLNHNDTAVTPGVYYYYSIDAVGSLGSGPCSTLNDRGHAKVSPPLNINGSLNLGDRVTVTWAPPAGTDIISGYAIYRSTSSLAFCEGTPLATGLASALTSYDDLAVSPGRFYFYSLRALSSTGDSECSTPIGTGYVLPSAPSGVSATDGTFTEKVQVSWNPPVPAGQTFDSYRLYRSDSAADRCVGTAIVILPDSELSYDDTSAVPGRIYYYTMDVVVSPFSPGSCSELSNAGHAQVSPPLGLSASSDRIDRILVTWDQPSRGDAVTGYKLYRSTTSQACTELLSTISTADQRSYNDFAVVSPTIYYYSVKATSAAGDSACSDIDAGALLAPPSDVQASDGSFENRVRVTWAYPSDAGLQFDNYRLYRSELSNDVCQGTPVATVSNTTTTFDDLTATPGVYYFYSVDAVGSLGNICALLNNRGHAKISPPLNINGSVGLGDRVTVTWAPPAGTDIISGYAIYRSTSSVACQGTPLATGLASALTSYDDEAVNPGRFYFYSLIALSSTGNSDCSAIGIGYVLPSAPSGVSATDGTFTEKVQVSWNPPVPAGQNFNKYRLYRSDSAVDLCAGTGIEILLDRGLSYADTSAVPGRIYYYTMDVVGSPGSPGSCSALSEGGYAQVSPPTALSASSDRVDRVLVNWNLPPGGGVISGYQLYRSLTSQACAELLVTLPGADQRSYNDFAVAGATVFYYSVKATSPTGESACSNIDSGSLIMAAPICRNGLDDDGDGLTDLADLGCMNDPQRQTEKNPAGPVCDNGIDDDGDGKIDYLVNGEGDKGCIGPNDPSERDDEVILQSPVYVKFNTFLGQWNFLELINEAARERTISITVFNLRGQQMFVLPAVPIPARREVDIDIANLVKVSCTVSPSTCSGFQDLSDDGIVDTYGLVKIEFDDSDATERLLGRMSFYRLNADDVSFSFAFARELRNATKGTTYATANTFDPQGQGFLVPNWAEVINLADSSKSFTINIYDQAGTLRRSTPLTLPALGEFDLPAGHELAGPSGAVEEGVFLVEVVPADTNSNYFLSLGRYSSNSRSGIEPETYNFAFSLEGRPGVSEPIYAPISNQIEGVADLSGVAALTNWVEVANVVSRPVLVTTSYLDRSGATLATESITLAPRSQFHFNAGAILPKGASGVVKITSNGPIVSQSMNYVHGIDNELQSGFISPARTLGRQKQSGSINTFLGMQSVLKVIATTSSAVDANLNIRNFNGQEFNGILSVNGNGASALRISNNPALSFPADSYGSLQLETLDVGQILAEAIRVRVVNGKVDFVMPTLVQ